MKGAEAMKDFTTPEYIQPIIDEIETHYTARADFNKFLNCKVIFTKKGTNTAFCVRENAPFYYSMDGRSAALKKLHAIILDYSNYAATEPGELDAWYYREQERIQDAIRDALILKYSA